MAGQMVHVEIPAGDTAKAREFWGSLFGWEFQAYEGSPTEYHMTRLSDTTGGAIFEADGDKRGARVYFDVDDINAGSARVRELGRRGGRCDAGSHDGLVRALQGHRGERLRYLADRPVCRELIDEPGGGGSRRPRGVSSGRLHSAVPYARLR